MESSPLTEIGLPIALAIIMVGIGLTLTVGDFRRELKTPKGVVVGSIGQLLLLPALGFVIISVLDLDPAIAVGLIIVAACPGGTTSNLISFLGRANVALSIVLTVVASIVTIVSLPLFTDLAIDLQASVQADGTSLEVPVLRTVLTLVAVVLVPVLVGMAVRARAPHRAASAEKAVAIFGAVLLVALIIGIALAVDDVVGLIRQAGPAVLLLNIGGIVIGAVLGRFAGLNWTDRLTLAIELGVKNSTLGILLGGLLGDLTWAVPSAVYGLLMYVSAGVLVLIGRRHDDVAPPVPTHT
ncbi:MAG: bile acid:sodium symporter family protein [Nitriliruptor sp.]|uniref:bile acid:sodium symporter family protein n=1 Tax=Nitriliruptor sp. TaxID=2448056 RepID=UPI0034A05CEA